MNKAWSAPGPVVAAISHLALAVIACGGSRERDELVTDFAVGTGELYATTAYPARLTKSVDGGRSWADLRIPETTALIDVELFSDGELHLVAADGATWRGNDGSWEAVRKLETEGLRDVDWRGGVGLAVDVEGRIFRTTDGGRTWVISESGTNSSLYAVAWAGSDVAWAAGQGGTLLRSEDGGATWEERRHGEAAIFGLGFESATIGWLAGAEGRVAATTDGGTTWREETVSARVIDAIVPLGGGRALFLGTGGFARVRAADGEWAAIEGAPPGDLVSGRGLAKGRVVVGGTGGRITVCDSTD